jgi:hypothetical protein
MCIVFIAATITVLGGALPLVAVLTVLVRSIRARRLERAVASMQHQLGRLIEEHDLAYMKAHQ